MKHSMRWIGAPVFLLLAILSGCGGGGGGSSSSATRSVQVFAANSQNSSFSHIWVTIHNVSIVQSGSSGSGSSDGTVIGSDDGGSSDDGSSDDGSSDDGSDTGMVGGCGDIVAAGSGRVVDLCSLTDTRGALYMFLGRAAIGSNPITSVNVTVSPNVSVVPAGSSSAVAATFAGATGTTFKMSLPVADANSLVVNFNLPTWTLSGGVLSASSKQFIASGSASNLAIGRFAPYDYTGTVGNLSGTAPSQQFGFARHSYVVNVLTNAGTSVYNGDGSLNPVLGDGEQVVVHGAYDSATGAIDAVDLAIKTATQSAPGARAEGVVTAGSGSSGALALQLTGADGFLPSVVSLQVTATPTTAFLGSDGKVESETAFFAGLTSGQTSVAVFGSVSSGTMQATLVKVLPAPVA